MAEPGGSEVTRLVSLARPSRTAVLAGGGVGLAAGGVPLLLLHASPVGVVVAGVCSAVTVIAGSGAALEWVRGTQRRWTMRVWFRQSRKTAQLILKSTEGPLTKQDGAALLTHVLSLVPAVDAAESPTSASRENSRPLDSGTYPLRAVAARDRSDGEDLRPR